MEITHKYKYKWKILDVKYSHEGLENTDGKYLMENTHKNVLKILMENT